MNPRRPSLVPVLFALCSCLSCTSFDFEPIPPDQVPPVADQRVGSQAAPPVAAEPVDAPSVPQTTPAPAQPVHVTAGGISDVRVGVQAPALTETLDRTLNMLAQARLQNEKLKEQLAAAEKELAAMVAERQELNDQLTKAGERVQEFEEAMEKWKQDVLGFRDEMRAYEEAEIEVLREVAVLLRGFKKETNTQP